MAARTLLGAKINLDMIEYQGQQYGGLDPKTRLVLLVRAIRNTHPVKLRKSTNGARWRFASVDHIIPQDIVYGRLCKVKDQLVERGLEPSEPTVEVEEGLIVADAYFVFHPESEIIVFEDRSPDISPASFVSAFRKLCIHNERAILDFTITGQPDKDALRTALTRFAKVTKVQFRIVHANWFWTKEMNNLDKSLKDAGARGGSMTFSNPKGLKQGQEFNQDALDMVENAYGRVTANGVDHTGKPVSVDSDQVLMQEKVPVPVSKEDRISKFYNFLDKVIASRVGG